jgi:RNA polymerase primary sigma factor
MSTTNTISLYMKEIMKYPLLTEEQEKSLVEQIHGEDRVLREKARTTLIHSNLRLVVKIAHDFQGRGLQFSDLISEGNLGLMQAVDKFDPSKETRFSTYAALWIKQFMRRAVPDQSGSIRVPVQAVIWISKLKKATVKLTDKLGRTPTDKELARELSIQERTVSDIRMYSVSAMTTSIQTPLVKGEDGTFEDVISDSESPTPDEILDSKEAVRYLVSMLYELNPRERKVIRLRYGLDGNRPRTLDEIGLLLNRSRERVRQIQKLALNKLRTNYSDEFGLAS